MTTSSLLLNNDLQAIISATSSFWGGLSGSFAITNTSQQGKSGWSFSFVSSYSNFDFWNADESAVRNSDGTYTITVKAPAGAAALAAAVVETIAANTAPHRMVYEDQLPLWDKINAVATRIYGAAGISADAKVRAQINELNVEWGHLPVCMAKTQMSFSTDPGALGAPTGHTVNLREVRLAAGAGFVVVIAGDLMTMPGLPKVPAAEHIDVDAQGNISGLF